MDFRAGHQHRANIGMKPRISLTQHFKIAPRRP
jgi:hypothetical protein